MAEEEKEQNDEDEKEEGEVEEEKEEGEVEEEDDTISAERTKKTIQKELYNHYHDLDDVDDDKDRKLTLQLMLMNIYLKKLAPPSVQKPMKKEIKKIKEIIGFQRNSKALGFPAGLKSLQISKILGISRKSMEILSISFQNLENPLRIFEILIPGRLGTSAGPGS